MNKPTTMTTPEQLKEEFKDYCNTDNFSAPPYETDIISDFWLNKFQSLLGEIEGRIKETQDKYRGIDKRTKEETYSGGGECRNCRKRRDALEVIDVLSIIQEYKGK